MVPIYFLEIKVVHVLTQSSAFAKCLDADDVGGYCTIIMIRQIQCLLPMLETLVEGSICLNAE
jgi:hypothetical protein